MSNYWINAVLVIACVFISAVFQNVMPEVAVIAKIGAGVNLALLFWDLFGGGDDDYGRFA